MPTNRWSAVVALVLLAVTGCPSGHNADTDGGADAGLPSGWTCPARDYKDGLVCHCACGVPDPDCATTGLIVSGCTNDEICTPAGTCTNCGNGTVDTADNEACDVASSAVTECAPQGYQVGQVPCNASCEWAYDQCMPLLTCNNGQLDTGELCDGPAIQAGLDCTDYGRTSGSLTCNTGCAINSTGCYTCGDGKIEGPETCDDHGTTSGNGCSSTCTIEPGYSCAGEPSVCAPICGDGIIKGAETCDDGDAFGNDGCSATCKVEADCSCTGTPSTCTCATVQIIATQTNYVYFDTASLILDANGQPQVSWIYGADYTEPVTMYQKEHAHAMFATKPAAAWTSTEIATWDQVRTTVESGEFILANDGGTTRQLVHRIYEPTGTFGVGTLTGTTWSFAYGNPYYIYDATRGNGEWHLLAAATGNSGFHYQSGAPGALTRDEAVNGIFMGYEVNIETSTTGDVYIASFLPNSGHTSYSMKVSKRVDATTWSTVYDVPTTGTCVYPIQHLPLRLPNGGMMFFEDGFNGTSRWLKAHRFNGTAWTEETVADLSYLSHSCSAGGASYSYASAVTAVDALGQPHILFRGAPDSTSTTIVDHYRTAAGWQTRSFPLTRARPFSMIIDAAGATHLVAAAANGTNFGDSKLVYIRIDANAWQ
ncbi:hypothetical protein BH11MYX3_BH11MYX3_16420 [soil metagenome]